MSEEESHYLHCSRQSHNLHSYWYLALSFNLKEKSSHTCSQPFILLLNTNVKFTQPGFNTQKVVIHGVFNQIEIKSNAGPFNSF